MRNRGVHFHISRRNDISWRKAWGIRCAVMALAFLLCGLITMAATGLNPIKVYAAMIDGNFGTSRRFWMLLQNMAVLLSISLALVPAFRMRFWNLGGDGQALMGALGAAACMILIGDKVPSFVLILIMAVASIVCGMVWAAIPAWFKAKFGTNETLFTLMMNYVAIQLVAFFVIVWEMPKGSGKIGIINQSTQAGWFPQIGGNKYLLNILIALLITALISFAVSFVYKLTIELLIPHMDKKRKLAIFIGNILSILPIGFRADREVRTPDFFLVREALIPAELYGQIIC